MSRLALVLEVGARHLETTGVKSKEKNQIRPNALGLSHNNPRGAIGKLELEPPPLRRQNAMRDKHAFEMEVLLGLFETMAPSDNSHVRGSPRGDSDDGLDSQEDKSLKTVEDSSESLKNVPKNLAN